MNRARLLLSTALLAFLSGLLGCDVAVVAVLMSRNGSKSKSSASAPAPDLRAFVYSTTTALTPDVVLEEGTLTTNGGNPGANWTQISNVQGTVVLTTEIPVGTDTLMVLVTSNQQYEIDSFEVLDTNGYPTSWGVGPVRNARVATNATSNPSFVTGRPDGKIVQTQATAGQNAFVFLRFPSPVSAVRISLWKPGQRGAGDMEWEYTAALGGSQSTGGCAVNSLDVIHVPFKNDADGSTLLFRLDSDGILIQDTSGVPADYTSLEPIGASAVPGSPSVAIQGVSNTIYVSTTAQLGTVHLFRFASNMTSRTTLINFAGSGGSRFEANGLCVDANGGKYVVGGTLRTSPAEGINPLIFQLNASDAVVSNTDRQGDAANNGWFGCIALPNLDALAVGDETVAGNLDALLTQVSAANLNVQTAAAITGGASQSDRALSVGIDSPASPNPANYYVGGYLGTGPTTSSGFITRINGGVFSSRTTYTLQITGDSQIQDIAVLADGTVYATGYETPGTRKILFVICIDPTGTLLWKRTHQLDVGDDQGVTISVSGTHVWVAGDLTVGAGNKDVHVRKYVR